MLLLTLPLHAEESDASPVLLSQASTNGQSESGSSESSAQGPSATAAEGGEKEAAQAAATAALLGPQSGIQLTLSWTLMSTVAEDPAFADTFSSLSIGANYKLHPKIFVTGSVSPMLSLNRMPNSNRRVDTFPLSSFVRFNFRNLYKEKLTGIVVGGSATYFLPTTYTDWFTSNTRFGETAGALQLFRNFGSVTMVGVLSARVPLMQHARPPVQCDPAKLMPGASCPSYTHTEIYNNLGFFGAGLVGIYNSGPWTVFFSGTVQELVTRGPWSASEPNNTNNNANRRAQFFNVLSVNYALGGALSAAIGYQNWGPQTSNGRDYTNFFFDRRYAYVFAGLDFVR